MSSSLLKKYNITMSSSFLKKSKQFTSVLDDLSEEKEIERLEKVVLEEADEVRKLQLQYCEAKRTLEKFQIKLENIKFSRLKRYGLNKLKDHVPDLLANIIEFIDSPKSLYNFILSSVIKQFAKNMNRVTWRENHFKKLFYDLNHVQIKSYVDAKKDKEQMELAQQQLENRIGRKIKDTPEEQEKIIQSIMESMIEDDDRLREAAKKRRNAFEILPALEDFDRDFAASTQVCCSALG